mmetsp:Transcript_87200/g.255213  ORF Transcript_87200/g.255213 Transcript_87200/m.255213 type:complete len:244 (+) Transcript_87200:628-1359(+)
MHVRLEKSKPREGSTYEDEQWPARHLQLPHHKREDHCCYDQPQPFWLDRVVRVRVKDGNDEHAQRIVDDGQQQQEVDSWVTRAEDQQGKHPSERYVCRSWDTPASEQARQSARLSRPHRCPRATSKAPVPIRRRSRDTSLSIKGACCKQQRDRDGVSRDGADDAAACCQQWVDGLPERIQGAAREQGLRHLFDGQPEEEAHEYVIDDEVQREAMEVGPKECSALNDLTVYNIVVGYFIDIVPD